MFKKCWLCGKRKMTLYKCCGREYCSSCFSEHHKKFHINRNVNKRSAHPDETNLVSNSGAHILTDPANKEVARYQVHYRAGIPPDSHEKEPEDGCRK